MIKFILLALLIVGAVSTQTKTAADECKLGREAILLHDIKELEFTSGHFTASRRVAAIPQLECVGGSARGYNEPDKVRCVNVGQYEPHWRCESTLDDSVKLGHVVVACEGYQGPLDPYVLKDSCGLKYSLEYTHWGSYILGHLYTLFTYAVITPLKWLFYMLLGAAILLVVTAAIRRPAHRQMSRSEGHLKTSVLNILFPSARETEAEEDDEDSTPSEKSKRGEKEGSPSKNVWENRLRDRKQIHSPYSDTGSPYHVQSTTGMAAR